MGNAASGETEPVRLKEELADMHRSLQALSVRCRPPPMLRPGQLSVDNVIIGIRPDVKVVLGPVVGKVEFQRARVLLEVNRRAEVTAHVSTLDAVTNTMVEVPQLRVAVHCEADRPAVFVLDRLVPGKSYTVTFGGVRKEDVEAKRARFRTQSLEHGSRLSAAVVSGDNVYDLESGEANMWKDVRERVERREVHMVLHLGGQVAMKRMFDKAVQLLLLHGEGLLSGAAGQSDWAMMEAKASDVLRSAYRTQWTLSPTLAFVLANASNLMMWSDEDVYPQFTTRDEFFIDHEQPTLRMQVIRTVTRCARRLFHEYQRQLWDDDFKQFVEREAELLAIAEKALASTAQIFVLASQIPQAAEDLELQKKRHEIEGARRVEKTLRALEAEKGTLEKQVVSFNQLLAPQRGEEFLVQIGSIGLLVLDLRSSRLEPGGAQARENELLSDVQWRFVEATLENADIELLVVCSETPLVDDVVLEAASSINASEATGTSWSANGPAQTRLLSQLFDWKLQQPSRTFLVLAGANPARCFARMRLKDTKLRTEAEQLTVGAISASPHASVVPKRSGLLLDRFEFEHVEEVVTKKGFLALKLESGQTNVIEAQRVGKDQHTGELAKVLLGPVVGWVDESCAVILVEVDRDADVVCLVENPLLKESRRVFQRFFAAQANSFFLTHLRPGHFYRVSFENVQHSERFQASFTSVSKSPQQFDVVALGNENKPLRTPGTMDDDGKEPHFWHAVAEHTLDMPFLGLNLTLHLGGQFFPESNVYIHEALVYAGDTMPPNPVTDSEGGDPNTAVLLGRFREMYRAAWNAPGVRESLAHGAHLMLTNENDQLPASNQDGEDQQNVSVRALLAAFHVRYQNLLLPPSKRLRKGDVRWWKPLHHCFGAFGLFVLPIHDIGGSCVHEATWDALRALLATPALSRLVLVSSEPLVEESLEEIREKASVDARYRGKLGFYRQDVKRLLELLFNWQRVDPDADRASDGKKQVVLLSGSRSRSFDSVIREAYNGEGCRSLSLPNVPATDSTPLFQYVVGPVRAPDATASSSAFSTQGTLLGRYTYRHSFVRKAAPALEESSPGLPDTTEGATVGKRVSKDEEATHSSNQLIHLHLTASQESLADAAEMDSTEAPPSFGSCSFISHDPIELENTADSGNPDPGAHDVRCCRVDAWQLSAVLPSWLQEIVARVTTDSEEEQIKERVDFLRQRESEIQAAFQRSPDLVKGLATLSRARQCAATLTGSFEAAHRAEGGRFRDKFPEPPSRFVVAFTLQQLRASEPPLQQLPSVGAVELEQYALLFQQSFVNMWLFNERIETFWR